MARVCMLPHSRGREHTPVPECHHLRGIALLKGVEGARQPKVTQLQHTIVVEQQVGPALWHHARHIRLCQKRLGACIVHRGRAAGAMLSMKNVSSAADAERRCKRAQKKANSLITLVAKTIGPCDSAV